MKKKKVFFNVISVFLLALLFVSCPNTTDIIPEEDNPPTPTNYTLTTTNDNGSISRSPDAADYNSGTVVSLEATADTGYKLLKWEGDYDGTSSIANPVSVTMDTDKTVSAIFVAIGSTTYTVTSTISPANSGTVSPNPDSVEEGSDTILTAAPAAGYRFSEWLDEDTTQIGTSSSLILTNITADKNITAVFQPEKWTVLVHFAVDNNIDYEFESSNGIVSNYLATLETIEAGDTYNNIDIIVLMDCYNEDTQGTGYATIFQDGYYHLTGGNFSDDLDVTITEVNSGSTSDAESFMDWVITNYPADHYMYSIFNHGGGFDDTNTAGTYGIGFDDSNDDALSHYELNLVTSYLKGLIGKNIDLFFPYACLMGGVELAYEIRNNIDYLLFSEELYPAEKWSYEALSSITSNPAITGEEIGTAFCDSAYTYFTTVVPRDFTLSLIDLSAIDALSNSINTYAQTAESSIGSSSTIASYYNTAAEDTFSMYSMAGVEWYYMDLGDYLSNVIANPNISSTVKSAASNVNNALNNAVLYKQQSGYPDATGMTIFHNIWNSTYQYPVVTYQNILGFGSNNWVDYLSTMENLTIVPTGDSYEPDDSFTDASPITIDGAAQDHTIHIPGDQDYIQFNLTAGTWYKIETYDNGGTSMDTELYLYDSTYSDIGYNDDSNGVYSAITYSCTNTGPYYAMVIGYDDTETGDYAIHVQTTTPVSSDSYEQDDSFVDATPITVDGAAQDHTLHSTDDIDTLYFNAISSQTYTIQATASGDILNIYLFEDGDYINSIGYGYVGSNIHFSCTSTGIYYIEIDSYGGGVGNYTIEVGSGTFSQQFDFGRNKEKPIR